MTELLQANIFFFITSAAVVLFSLIIILILFQIYKIIKLIRSVMERIETASEIMAEDAEAVRQLIAKKGLIASVLGFMIGTKRKKRKHDIEPEKE